MCRNIRPLNNYEPPATNDEVTAAAAKACVTLYLTGARHFAH